MTEQFKYRQRPWSKPISDAEYERIFQKAVDAMDKLDKAHAANTDKRRGK